MSNILFLSAPLKERIWGGNYFKDELKVTDSNSKIGEMWTCSGHIQGESYILEGIYKGLSLSQVYKNHSELFGNPKAKEFPILIKIISADDDLSVQVHPNDEYARKNENSSGKTEGWLILKHEPEACLVVGHNACSKEELVSLIKSDNYDKLLKKVKVNDGEFYPIPSGTIHAIGKGIVLLEVQQSSDITYRFYDYHRKDKDGKERELHVKKAIDVTDITPYSQQIKNINDITSGELYSNQYFKIDVKSIDKKDVIKNLNGYKIISVIEGKMKVEGRTIKLGDSFIITSLDKAIKVEGTGRIAIITTAL
jgi:mannose-6-phosphate isomerase